MESQDCGRQNAINSFQYNMVSMHDVNQTLYMDKEL